MARISAGNDDKVNFAEFVKYVVEHEKRLEAIFQDLDKNNDGELCFFLQFPCKLQL